MVIVDYAYHRLPIGQVFDQLGMLVSKVICFATIDLKIVQLWLRTVVLAEEFPFAFAEGQIG